MGNGGGFWGGGFNLNDRPIAGYNTIAENFETYIKWSYYNEEEGLLQSFTILIASLPARFWSHRLTDPTFLGTISKIEDGSPRSQSPQPVTRPPLSYTKCFNSFKFSSNFTGSARTVAEVVEVGSQLSLLGDMAATAYKMSARSAYIGGTRNRYASGLNFLFRRAANAVGSSTLKGTLTGIGNRVTPALAVTGAFTGGYNVSVAVQCATGILN